MWWHDWWFGFGLVHVLLNWAVLILAVVLVVKWLAAPGGWARGNRALDILKERYARGEIGKDEFEQKKRDLQ